VRVGFETWWDYIIGGLGRLYGLLDSLSKSTAKRQQKGSKFCIGVGRVLEVQYQKIYQKGTFFDSETRKVFERTVMKATSPVYFMIASSKGFFGLTQEFQVRGA